jgi:hypothetical protein
MSQVREAAPYRPGRRVCPQRCLLEWLHRFLNRVITHWRATPSSVGSPIFLDYLASANVLIDAVLFTPPQQLPELLSCLACHG